MTTEKMTPGPWAVRKMEENGELTDCFVEAPDVNGFAYKAEILGDDEYRDSMERKLADCEFIADARNVTHESGKTPRQLLQAATNYRQALELMEEDQRKRMAQNDELMELARMVGKASMGGAYPTRGESFIGWQSGDKINADDVRTKVRAIIDKYGNDGQ